LFKKKKKKKKKKNYKKKKKKKKKIQWKDIYSSKLILMVVIQYLL